MSRTMFERYGGFASVSKIVMAFYDKALDSNIIGHHFEDVEMSKLVDHQTKFIASVMGGPAAYTDEALHRLHSHLKIDHGEFKVKGFGTKRLYKLDGGRGELTLRSEGLFAP